MPAIEPHKFRLLLLNFCGQLCCRYRASTQHAVVTAVVFDGSTQEDLSIDCWVRVAKNLISFALWTMEVRTKSNLMVIMSIVTMESVHTLHVEVRSIEVVVKVIDIVKQVSRLIPRLVVLDYTLFEIKLICCCLRSNMFDRIGFDIVLVPLCN